MRILTAATVIISCTYGQLTFASLGNFGGPHQHEVVSTLRKDATNTRYSLLLSPGSCFSDVIDSVDDRKWKTEFEDVFTGSEFTMPFFSALGEKDWEGNVTAMVRKTSESYAANALATKGAKWTIPNFYYHYTQTFTDTSEASVLVTAPEVSAFFVVIDTKMLSPGFIAVDHTERHWEDLRATLAAASKTHDWIIVVGDKGMYSSGSSGGDKFLRRALRPLLKDTNIDAYISGYDHNMEIIEDGSLTHITCGNASSGKMGKIRRHDGSIAYSSAPGYCRHRLTKNVLRTELVDGYTGETLAFFDKTRNGKSATRSNKLLNQAKIPKVEYTELPPGVGGMPGGDSAYGPNPIFVTIIGTIGLAIGIAVAAAGAVTLNLRAGRWISDRHIGTISSDKNATLIQ